MELLHLLFIPLVAAATSWFITQEDIRDTVMVSLAGWLCYSSWQVYAAFRGGKVFSDTFVTLFPGLGFNFTLEPLGMLFALIVSILWLVTAIYAIGYMRAHHKENQNRFFCFFSLSIAAALGVAFSGNLLTLFIFYELLTLSTYPLVTHDSTPEAQKGGFVYLAILMTTSIICLLPAIAITYHLTGSVTFTAGGILQGHISSATCAILLALFMFGIGKAALMPLHRWLPAAMVAPTPVSALLHAVAVVKTGVFTVVKVITYVFGAQYLTTVMEGGFLYGGWLVYLAGFSIIAASIVALRQDNLKRRLAYSTVSQLSYVTMAAALLTPKALIAATFHIAAHACGKITLFFAAGNIAAASGKKYVSELSGIGKTMPITMIAFAIGALSMIGIPPAAGFISKWYLLEGSLVTENFFVVFVLVTSTLLNAYYFLPVIYQAFFGTTDNPPDEQGEIQPQSIKEAPWQMVVAISATALATLLLFISPEVVLNLAHQLIN
jgi:multicomponent Na+:H+ antiporter subunit D